MGIPWRGFDAYDRTIDGSHLWQRLMDTFYTPSYPGVKNIFSRLALFSGFALRPLASLTIAIMNWIAQDPSLSGM